MDLDAELCHPCEDEVLIDQVAKIVRSGHAKLARTAIDHRDFAQRFLETHLARLLAKQERAPSVNFSNKVSPRVLDIIWIKPVLERMRE